MENKRGQGLSTNTIILLILGVIILVILILGFVIGWDKIAPFLSKNNVDSIVNSCETACSTASVYSFCSAPRDLNSDSEELESVTCFFLAEKRTIYGVEGCDYITCENILIDLDEGETLDSKCVGNEGEIIQALINNKLETKECPTVYNTLEEAKAACETEGEKIKYKEGTETEEYTCLAEDVASSS